MLIVSISLKCCPGVLPRGLQTLRALDGVAAGKLERPPGRKTCPMADKEKHEVNPSQDSSYSSKSISQRWVGKVSSRMKKRHDSF